MLTRNVYSCIGLLKQCTLGNFCTHIICTLEIKFSRNNYSASSLNNWTFLLFKYQPFLVFSFNILRNPEQRKLEFFYTAVSHCKFPKFICLTDI